jgi:iron complex outermembrane receptor protein
MVDNLRKNKYTSMNKYSLPLLVMILIASFSAHAQESINVEISGVVTHVESGKPLSDVTIQVKGTVTGAVTNSEGEFSLRTKTPLPFKIIFSSIGFKEQEIEIKSLGSSVKVSLATQTVLGNEIVVSPSRMPENILKSPVAVEKLDIRAIRETPAPSFYDALENVKGVQMTTSSITFKVPNTRGFNIPNNFRFMQLVDGVDMQAATLGVPLGNAIGPTEIDVQSVEITPGAASALYGMNAINGMANLVTKSPFTSQGLSVYQRIGVNHVDRIAHDPGIMRETAVRFAKAFNNRFAFKLNASYLNAVDWQSNNTTDQNPNSRSTANPLFPELNGKENNPAYDAWNKYGDENNNAVTINGVSYNGTPKTFILCRTGYWEKDLVNPVVENLKLDGAVHYRLNEKIELAYAYRLGKMDGVFQRGNKIQLNDVVVQNHKLELKGQRFLLRAYTSSENTGNSFNLKPLVDNLQLTHLSNSAWASKFKSALQTRLNDGQELAAAMRNARLVADQGRFEPGTEAFDQLKKTIIGINNWDHVNAGVVGAPATGGAWLTQKSHMYHADFQYDLSQKIRFADVLVGADARVYEVIPDGNNFVDFSRPIAERNQPTKEGDYGKHVYYSKYGAFAQLTKTFFKERLKAFASLRFDQNLEFSPKVNPRLALVYTASERHNFRVTFQNGYRFPSLFEALSFVNNGNVRRVGGLAYINEGLGYLDNSYTLTSVNDFNAAVNKDVTGGSSAGDAALKNRALLVKTDLAETSPEHINSFEIGYKSVLNSNRLVIDWDAYINDYKGFLGQVEVSVPVSGAVGTDQAVNDMLASNRSKQVRYRVFTNAKNTYRNYGSSLGINWLVYKKFSLNANLSYNNIVSNKKSDVFLTAFNTPKWVTNISFGNREVFKNLGFNIVWRWQDAFDWESPLANGGIPSYQTIDAQVSFKVPAINSFIKVGGSNIFNKRFIQYAAGPTIGGLYYVAWTVDGLLK